MVWPLDVGRPVPTVPKRTAEPELSDTYNWPLKIPGTLKLVTVVLSCVEAPTVPSVAYRIPLLELVIHISVPLLLVAPRILPVGSLRAVVVSIVPAASTRPTTLFVVAGASEFGAEPPGALLYPPSTRNAPSAERSKKPSDVELPAAVSISFAPFAAVGIAMD